MMGRDFPGKYVSYEILSKNAKKQSNVLYNSRRLLIVYISSGCIWSFSL
ncbi:DEHA2B16302p [Debaryomyces hansenii CBS767]|uniref:DEHA2B16302p n=1 Tax=Debaryomyces hansenii (strain ATCC 36239 / CBS 767 / BCRC 21394 / JCM 1990 / NBRC 0083 / IGC 2968) TaxID=284592 RepID=Q6BVV9_DEBHA|nr:DEHA2B16302p [Debaryomyces hansenii CBS767]CAG85674.1 DEHA2B16302p [Debaryomyces hansenii CBS767]|eukprot:XP_457660.1 DEHA2B16302p [Debaryomyces hansenii CBS767]